MEEKEIKEERTDEKKEAETRRHLDDDQAEEVAGGAKFDFWVRE